MNHVDIQDILDARRRITPYINKTPIFSSSRLNQWLGHTILFKAEGLQKIGAFKARGACNTIAWLKETGQTPKGIVSNSSGNHAQAVAWASAQFNIPSQIFMPSNVSPIKAQATRSYGGATILCKDRAETDLRVQQAAQESGQYWIPPYNHTQVIAGQGTAALEVFYEHNTLDAIFAPCGGGGLLSGTLISARALSKANVIGVEPLAANDAAQSLRQGSIQSLKGTPNTIADGVMTPCLGEITFEYVKQVDDFYEINETSICYWTQWLSHLLKLHIEPTSAMSMEAACQWLKKQRTKKTICVILSGANIDHKKAMAVWSTDYLAQTPSMNNEISNK